MIFFQCKSRIAIGIKEDLVKYKGKRTSQDVVFILFSSLIGLKAKLMVIFFRKSVLLHGVKKIHEFSLHHEPINGQFHSSFIKYYLNVIECKM